MNEVLDSLNKNIQSLRSFVQTEDYRLQTVGLNGSLMDIYTNQMQALGELHKCLRAAHRRQQKTERELEELRGAVQSGADTGDEM